MYSLKLGIDYYKETEPKKTFIMQNILRGTVKQLMNYFKVCNALKTSPSWLAYFYYKCAQKDNLRQLAAVYCYAAAVLGHPEAKMAFQESTRYHNIPRDFHEAIQSFLTPTNKLNAEKKDSNQLDTVFEAHLYFSRALKLQKTKPEDYITLLRKAAEHGHLLARNFLADISNKPMLHQIGAKEGLPDSQFKFGKFILGKIDNDRQYTLFFPNAIGQAKGYIKSAALSGHQDAIEYLNRLRKEESKTYTSISRYRL